MEEFSLNFDPSVAHGLGVESLNTIILHLIIASSALLTFTITFLEKLKLFGNYNASKLWLLFSWTFLVISIFTGAITLFRLSGFLLMYKENVKLDFDILVLATLQFGLFCLAMFCILIFAVESTTGIFERIKLSLKNSLKKRRKKRYFR